MHGEKSINKISTIEIVFTALSISLITIGAFIKIDVGFVAFTLQLAFVMLISLVFGSKIAFASTSIYTLMGLIGLPVFSRGGGLAYLASPGFGYILGFSLAAISIGYLGKSKNLKNSFIKTFVSTCIGLLLVYLVGVTYWYILSIFIMKEPENFFGLIWKGAIVFAPKDLFICLVVSVVAPKLKKIINY